METYLRIGQEQTMVGTAGAVATALHERPALFDSQSAYLTDVKPGTDLYAHKIFYPIQLRWQVRRLARLSTFSHCLRPTKSD